MFDILANTSTLSYLLPLIFFVIFFQKALDNLGYYILIISLLSFVSNVLAYFFQSMYENCNPIYHYYTILDTSLLCWVYFNYLKSNSIKLVTFIIWLLFFVVAIQQLKADYWGENIFATISSKLIMISISLMCLLNPFLGVFGNIADQINFKRFNIAVLLFNSATIIVSFFEPILREKNNLVLEIGWSINLLSILLYNFLLSFTIWKMKR